MVFISRYYSFTAASSILLLYVFACYLPAANSIRVSDLISGWESRANSEEGPQKGTIRLERKKDNSDIDRHLAEGRANSSPEVDIKTNLELVTTSQFPGSKTNKIRDEATNLCQNANFDTMVKTNDGSIYVFKSNYYWRFYGSEGGLSEPRLIATDWPGLPSDLDAAFTWPDKQGITYFFKGDQSWRFLNKEPVSQGPEEIPATWPRNMDTVMLEPSTGVVHFFKDRLVLDYKDDELIATTPFDAMSWLKDESKKLVATYVQGNDNFFYFFDDGTFSNHKATKGGFLSTAKGLFGCVD